MLINVSLARPLSTTTPASANSQLPRWHGELMSAFRDPPCSQSESNRPNPRKFSNFIFTALPQSIRIYFSSVTFKTFYRFLQRRSPFRLTPRTNGSRNVVVLGSLGVGKSSLVNMLIGRPVAPVSNDIGVVHPIIVEYLTSLSELSSDPSSSSPPVSSNPVLRVYDTIGLEHRPSPWAAIKSRLKGSGGVDVVIYCMRRGRLSNEQVSHLRTIWKTFCRGHVPLLLVVSGVEYRRGSIQKWWEANGEDLENVAQVGFTDHICLNTWAPNHASWKHQGASYEETQRLVHDFVIRHCPDLHSVS